MGAARTRIATAAGLALAAALASAETIVWKWQCDTNPTTLDVNSDGTNDWIVRGGGAFDTNNVGTNGVRTIWIGGQTLDTRPLRHWDDRRIDVELTWRSLGAGDWDAVFWINLDYRPDWGIPGGTFAPLPCRLRNIGTQQVLQIHNVQDPGWTEVLLGAYTNSTTNFVDTRLEIHPPEDRIEVYIDNVHTGQVFYVPKTTANNEDAFATILGGAAEFDYVRIRVDPRRAGSVLLLR